MRTSFYGVDVVHIRVNIFIVRSIVSHGNFYRNAIFLVADVNNIINQFFTRFVDITDKFFQSFFGVENFFSKTAIFFHCSFIDKR